MGSSCTCFPTSSYLDAKTFHSLNEYVSRTKQSDTHVTKILNEIAPGSINPHHLNTATYVAELEGNVFIDKNFESMENGNNLEVSPLSKMYNFSKFGLERVFKRNYNTSMSIFDQKQVQLCYLNCIFYLVCCSDELKKQIFVTQQVNKHKLYIINLFCLGQLTNVVVDQNVPTMHQNIKFLSVRTPGQLWPFLLEKAWCKQIGGYHKARGLSPEDCFQQITGIPASSVQLKKFRDKDIWDMLCKSYNDNYWISFTANENQQQYGIKSRQVFYLESLNETRNSIILRSPFKKFDYHSKRSDSGQIQLKMEELMLNFDFATIGAFSSGFASSSLEFASMKNEQLIFEVTLPHRTRFNLRIIQFYSQYLSEIEKETYQYSSILMELYDKKKNLVENSAGSLGSYSKTRSSQISDDFFIELPEGTYYLRVQVNWHDQKSKNTANIVTYAPKNTVRIKKYEDERDGSFDFCAGLLSNSLESKHQMVNEEQQIKIRYIQKRNGYIIGIQNTSNEHSQFKMCFKNSINIAINHYHLENNVLLIKLNGLQERVIEVLPKDPNTSFVLDSFEITRN